MLYILPFDHRGSFQKMLFPTSKSLSEAEKETIRKYKRLIFESMKLIGSKRGYDDLAILVDEEYGADIHRECKKLGIRNILTTEKSGQKIFDFEYEDWKDHLMSIHPTIAKALIRVTVGEDNTVQNSRLKELNDFCAEKGFGFLIEPLIEPSPSDLEQCGGDKKRFDRELRPKRFTEAVQQMHAAGVHPDVWKIEGTETKEAMDICSEAVFSGGKPEVQIVILGRGATTAEVAHWLQGGAKSKGVMGFAIGRTVFSEPIMLRHQEKMTDQETVETIAKNYQYFIDVFENARK